MGVFNILGEDVLEEGEDIPVKDEKEAAVARKEEGEDVLADKRIEEEDEEEVFVIAHLTVIETEVEEEIEMEGGDGAEETILRNSMTLSLFFAFTALSYGVRPSLSCCFALHPLFIKREIVSILVEVAARCREVSP